MKKYIRTKDHIYKRLFIDKAIINELGVGACDKDLNPLNEDIIKESDTIEELCDGFVIKVKTGYETGYLITYHDEKLLKQDAYKNGADVYGAIWTDKGLIYVAKMNGKVELELL